MVEQDLLARQRGLVGAAVLGRDRRGPVVGVGDRDAARGAVLAALEGAPVVPPAAVARRHRQVGLLGARLGSPRTAAPQVREVGRPGRGPGVLGLEVRRDLGVVLGAQPVVVVGPRAAVVLGGHGTAVGDGGPVGLVPVGRRAARHARDSKRWAAGHPARLASRRARAPRRPARPGLRAHRRGGREGRRDARRLRATSTSTRRADRSRSSSRRAATASRLLDVVDGDEVVGQGVARRRQ